MILDADFKEVDHSLNADFGVVFNVGNGGKGDVDYSLVANALKGNASGSAVALTDISPLEHILGIKARSENKFDINKVVDEKQGGAYIEISGNDIIFTYGTTNTNHFAFSCEVDVTPNTDYVLSIGNTTSIAKYYVYTDYLFGKVLKTNVDINTGVFNSGNNRKLIIGFYSIQAQRVGTSEVISGVMINEGRIAKPYVPYADLSTAKVIKRNAQLFNIAKISQNTRLAVGSGVAESNSQFNASDYIYIPSGTTFTGNYIQGCAFYDANKHYVSDIGDKSSAVQRTLTMPINACYMRFDYKKANVNESVMQVQIGEKLTEFEPFKEPTTHPISADGTVEDVTSLYPTTTLISDIEGIVLDVEYNRDINKAFAELVNALISLGGNV